MLTSPFYNSLPLPATIKIYQPLKKQAWLLLLPSKIWSRRIQVRHAMQLWQIFKQQRRSLKAHSVRHASSALFYLYDPLSRNKILIDTGAEVSVLSATASQKTLPSVTHFYAASGSKIPMYKRKTLRLELNLCHTFKWTFYVGVISQAIFGADFLTHFALFVNIKTRKLQNPLTTVATSAAIITGESGKCTS